MTYDYTTTKQQRILAAADAQNVSGQGYYVVNGSKVLLGPGRGVCKYVTEQEPTLPDTKVVRMTRYTMAAMDSFEALQLAASPGRTAVLNFACATTPGGGFLSGSRAQEECLCRMSTLYESLKSETAGQYYTENREWPDPLRPVTFLYSPNVDVFRNPDLSWKEQPVRTQVITMAAPNVKNGRARNAAPQEVKEYFLQAIRTMCSYLAGKADTLVLGAWGCGAFGNDPAAVAGWFRQVLVHEGFARSFDQIIFAVRDGNSGNYKAFRDELSSSTKIREVPERKRRESSGNLRKKNSGGGTVRKEFAKGEYAYMVEPDDEAAEKKTWHKRKVHIKSSGSKYVTVGDIKRTVKFITSEKPALLSDKGGSYLVSTDERAEKLISMLNGTAAIAPGRQEE